MRWHGWSGGWRTGVLVMLTLTMMCGCSKTLFTKLSEADANDTLAVLLDAGISAAKDSEEEGKTWAVSVSDNQFSRALNVLRAHGLPHQRYQNLGELFKKEGLISTPTEERVRFIYGVSQQLSEVLSRIDGVVYANVQIVVPNNDPLAPVTRPSSASVFIKYLPGADVTTLTPGLKNLVVHAVEGLTYDNVSVTMVPGVEPPVARAAGAARGTWDDAWGEGMAAWLGAAGVLLILPGVLAWRWHAPLRRSFDAQRTRLLQRLQRGRRTT
nr:type III secretion inner membrane ring lipoprotein SctJ [Paraburkholderia hayleyella]